MPVKWKKIIFVFNIFKVLIKNTNIYGCFLKRNNKYIEIHKYDTLPKYLCLKTYIIANPCYSDLLYESKSKN